tara:strand:- start:764 stop:1126 length:363 start_codon:yes stop_codon:yes gene_type:complete
MGDGGALTQIKRPFLMWLGGVLGSGQQWMNWIYIQDLVDLFIEALTNKQFEGAYNAVSPGNVTNKIFSKTLATILERPMFFKIPAIMIKLIFGELSQEVLRGQKVLRIRRKNKLLFKFVR